LATAAFAVVLALFAPAAGQEPPPETPVGLLEARAWRGTIEAEARSRPAENVTGEERQAERLEVLLATEPLSSAVVAPQLPFQKREVAAWWTFVTDRTEGQGDQARTLKAAGEGRLHARVTGFVLPTLGRYALRVELSPRTLAIPGTLSGIEKGRLETYRSAIERTPLLHGFLAECSSEEGGRRIRGERTLVDGSGSHPRDVTIRWDIRRIDPVLAGRLTGPGGIALPGVRILARTTNPDRVRQGMPPLLFEEATDPDGRFEIPAWFAIWSLEVRGFVKDDLLVEGFFEPELALRFDDVPRFETELRVYRLAGLPRARQLDGYFRGDVARYLEWIRARWPEPILERARVHPRPPDERAPDPEDPPAPEAE